MSYNKWGSRYAARARRDVFRRLTARAQPQAAAIAPSFLRESLRFFRPTPLLFTNQQQDSLSERMRPLFEKMDRNCLKEIATYGGNDFTAKSYRLNALLRRSVEDNFPVSGQDGLSGAEDDWRAAWGKLSKKQKTRLAGAYNTIDGLIKETDKAFYGF